jgi:hypothetical protein
MLFSIRSERLLMEEIDYSVLFRWFVGLNLDEEDVVDVAFRRDPTGSLFPRKRDVRPKLSSAKASPPAFQSATAHPQARSGLKAKGAPLFNSGPFLLSPLGRISLIRRFPAWLLPPLRGKFIAFHRGIPLSSTFKNPQGFGAISPATPFPEVLLRTQSRDLFRHCYVDELV